LRGGGTCGQRARIGTGGGGFRVGFFFEGPLPRAAAKTLGGRGGGGAKGGCPNVFSGGGLLVAPGGASKGGGEPLTAELGGKKTEKLGGGAAKGGAPRAGGKKRGDTVFFSVGGGPRGAPPRFSPKRGRVPGLYLFAFSVKRLRAVGPRGENFPGGCWALGFFVSPRPWGAPFGLFPKTAGGPRGGGPCSHHGH